MKQHCNKITCMVWFLLINYKEIQKEQTGKCSRKESYFHLCKNWMSRTYITKVKDREKNDKNSSMKAEHIPDAVNLWKEGICCGIVIVIHSRILLPEVCRLGRCTHLKEQMNKECYKVNKRQRYHRVYGMMFDFHKKGLHSPTAASTLFFVAAMISEYMERKCNTMLLRNGWW